MSFKPSIEELESRDCPSASISPQFGIDSPQINPATLSAARLAVLVNCQANGGLGPTAPVSQAVALQQLQQNYATWYAANGAAWNATCAAAAVSQPGSAAYYQSWEQQPPPVQSPSPTQAAVAQTAKAKVEVSAATPVQSGQPTFDFGAYGAAWLAAHHHPL